MTRFRAQEFAKSLLPAAPSARAPRRALASADGSLRRRIRPATEPPAESGADSVADDADVADAPAHAARPSSAAAATGKCVDADEVLTADGDVRRSEPTAMAEAPHSE